MISQIELMALWRPCGTNSSSNGNLNLKADPSGLMRASDEFCEAMHKGALCGSCPAAYMHCFTGGLQ